MEQECVTASKKRSYTDSAKASARRLLLEKGNSVKLTLALLFTVGTVTAASMLADAVFYCLLPAKHLETANSLKLAFLPTLYFAMDVKLLRFGIRVGRNSADITEFFDRGRGSGASASYAVGVGTLILTFVCVCSVSLVSVLENALRAALGSTGLLICTVCIFFLAAVAFIYIFTGMFFLAAIAERKNTYAAELISESFKTAKGRRFEILRFVFSFLLLTALSALSLGILFFIYVVPHYILSYGELSSQILDTEDL